jgi:hypothetical protein
VSPTFWRPCEIINNRPLWFVWFRREIVKREIGKREYEKREKDEK